MGLLACQDSQAPLSFEAFQENYRQAHQELYPGRPSPDSQHCYNYLLAIPDAAHRQQQRLFCQAYQQQATQFSPKQLQAEGKQQLEMIEKELARIQFELDSVQTHAMDAGQYHLLPGLQANLQASNLSVEDQLRILQRKMQFVPDYFQAAKDNLRAEARGYELALQQQRATYLWLDQELLPLARRSALSPQEQQLFGQHVNWAKLAVKDFLAYCKSRWIDQQTTSSSPQMIK
ncbi:MAG: hypothetical protein AAFV95_23710 [Bacteroidota bacterium]